jgi:hypothetical protein
VPKLVCTPPYCLDHVQCAKKIVPIDKIIPNCREHLLIMAALHWTRAPKLYYIFCCLLTFSYLPNTFCTFLVTDWLNFIARLLMCPITLCMFLVADWLNLIAFPLLCPITRKIGASLQSVTSNNLCVLTSHLVQRRLLGFTFCSLMYLDLWTSRIARKLIMSTCTDSSCMSRTCECQLWGLGFRY